jgi:hypothetical protein
MRLTSQIAVVALLVAAGAAQASVDVFSFNYGPLAVPYSGTGNLAKFDTAGGTKILTGVKLDFTSTLKADVSVTSLSGPQTVTVGVVGSSSANDGIFTLPNSLSGSFVSPVLNTGDVHNFGTISSTDAATQIVPSALWALYTGAGTFPVNYSGNGLFGIQGGGNATIDVTNFGGEGTVTVTYTWELIPTPGAAALLGLGGLVAARRRRA